MIYTQTFRNSLGFVIVTQHQFCTTYITDIFHFRRIVFDVVSASASRAGTASTHSVYDVLIRNFNVDCIINSFTHFLQRSF